MKKSSRRDHPSEPSSRHRREKHGGDGRWELGTSGSLIALGSTDSARRAAYRTSGGQLRFLPL
jgi:hypothetical protein